MSKILALDPNTTTGTGWALFHGKRLSESGLIHPRASDSLHDRLADIRANVLQIAYLEISGGEVWRSAMVVEMPWKITGHSAASAAAMNQLIGVLRAASFEIACPFHEVQVSEWRSVLGVRPGTPKAQAKAAACAFVKMLYKKDVDDNEAEAICIGHWFVNRNYGVEK